MVELNANESRALGVLVEKSLTTPDQYPLTINAVVNGANQKNNRHPITDIDDGDVLSALIGLRTKGLVVQQDAPGQRAPRWRHRADEGLKINKPELVILAELLLRGPQTLGELRGRASRMHPLDSLDMVRTVIEQLTHKPDGPMVKQIPPSPGSRAERYVQLLCPDLHPLGPSAEADDDDDTAEPDESPRVVGATAAAAAPPLNDRVAKLEAEVATLRAALLRLAAEMGVENLLGNPDAPADADSERPS